MKIFLLTETMSGCYKWRAAIPAKYLRRLGHQVQILSLTETPAYEAPDVIVLYRAHFAEGVKIANWCKKKGIRVVFDTDDAIDLVPPENLNYRLLRDRLGFYQAVLEAADVVTTTTETLAEHLRKSNPNVMVVPNTVDPEEWSVEPRTGTVRLGWTGSPTHFSDLALALEVVRELQKKHDFLLVLQGLCLEPSLDDLYQVLIATQGKQFLVNTALGRAIKHFMTRLSGIRYEFHPNVPIEAHSRTVSELALDIGIAPLTDNPFNRHKSCIKYYEYAMTGAVTVASHVLPYSSEVPITARNTRESWKEKLETVLTGDRAAMWREQRDWVLAHRNIENTVKVWEQILSGDKVGAAPRGPARVEEEVAA